MYPYTRYNPPQRGEELQDQPSLLRRLINFIFRL